MPIWVEGGEWNQTNAVCGIERLEVGDGERERDIFVFCRRFWTASESSEPLSSDDDAEPESESSRSLNVRRCQTNGIQQNGLLLVNAPSTRRAKSVADTGFPPFNRILTLYRCQSERKCVRCSSTSLKTAPRQTLHARAPVVVCEDVGSGDAGREMSLGGFWVMRFRGVRLSRSSGGREKT